MRLGRCRPALAPHGALLLAGQFCFRRRWNGGRRFGKTRSHGGGAQGWRLLLRDLTEHATQREFVHIHKWTLHDLVMWDNRQTMHRVRRYDQSQPRDMRRATVAGTEPTVQQQAAE